MSSFDEKSDPAERQVTSLVFDSALNGGLTLVGIALSLGAALLWIHLLPPEAYALLGTFLLVGQVGRNLLGSYSQSALLHYGRLEVLERGAARRSFWSSLLLVTPTLLLGGIAGIFLARPLSSYLGGGSYTVLLIEAYVLALVVSGLQVQRLQAENRFGLATSIGILDRAFVVVVALFLFFSSEVGASEAQLTTFVAAAAAVAVALVLRPPGLPRIDAAQIRPMARFSSSIVVGAWMATLFSWGDFALATYFLSATDLACYYLATQGLGVLLQLSQVIGIVTGPLTISLIARGQFDRARKLFGRGAGQLNLLASMAAAVLIASSSVLVPLVIPRSYGASLEPLVLLIAASATAPLYFFSLSVFNAYRRPDLITAATVILGGGNLVLSLLLVPWLGSTGAALAKGLSLGIGAIYACRRALQLLEVAWRPGLLLALTPALVAVGPVILYPGPWGGLAALALGGITSAAALRYGKLIEADDVARLQTIGFPTWTRPMLQAALRVAS